MLHCVDWSKCLAHVTCAQCTADNVLDLSMQACENGIAFVLPAFETYGNTTAEAAATADRLIYSDKAALVSV
jgi:hypothetical protein